MAILSAVSTASEPELVKNTWSKPWGATLTSRDAASNTFGWPIWKVGAKSSSAACFWMASVIFGRQWPAFVHQSPAVPSSTLRPSSVV